MIDWNAVAAIGTCLGVTISGMLTWIIIRQTHKLNKQANEQQISIVETEIKIQQDLAKRSLKVGLYQYRMECYMQIVTMMDILSQNDVLLFIESSDEPDHTKKTSAVLGEAYQLSKIIPLKMEVLFDSECNCTFNEINLLYYNYYNKIAPFLIYQSNEKKELEILLTKMKKDKHKFNSYLQSEDGYECMKEKFPNFLECYNKYQELHEKINAGEWKKVILPILDMKNLDS